MRQEQHYWSTIAYMPTTLPDNLGVYQIYGTDLPLSHMGHQVSWIKMDFWAFLCFSLKFSPFCISKSGLFLFIICMVPGTFWNKSKLNLSGAWWLLNRGDNNWRTLIGMAKRCPWPLSTGLSSHCFLQIFWDFDHWLFNRGWPLNGGWTVTLNSNDCWYNFYIFL